METYNWFFLVLAYKSVYNRQERKIVLGNHKWKLYDYYCGDTKKIISKTFFFVSFSMLNKLFARKVQFFVHNVVLET